MDAETQARVNRALAELDSCIRVTRQQLARVQGALEAYETARLAVCQSFKVDE